MPILSPITGTSMPEGTDPPAGHTQMTSLVGNLERYVVGRFATTAARDAAIPAPTDGMIAVVLNRIYIRLSGAWVALAGAYHSGVFTTTMGATTTVTPATLSLPPGNWIVMAKGEATYQGTASGVGLTMQIYNGTAGTLLDKTELFSSAAGAWRHGLFTMTPITLTAAATIVRVQGLSNAAAGLGTLEQNRIWAIAAPFIN